MLLFNLSFNSMFIMQFASTRSLTIVVKKGGVGKGIIVSSMIGQLELSSSRDEDGGISLRHRENIL